MPAAWSHHEVTLTVEAYFDMLEAELAGISYKKTSVRRELLPKLDGRTNGSLEFKNCNISAALISLGLPSIAGYKPRWNYQRDLLHAVIGETLRDRPRVFEAVEKAVEEDIETPGFSDILSIYDDSPPERDDSYKRVHEPKNNPSIVKKNYLEQEARNEKTGSLGEEIVMEYERARLIALEKENLVDRIEHVSKKQGDGAGYDVRSFDERGRDFFIEVKTTRFRKETPFFISANEVSFSKSNADQYALYRVYALSRNPRLFILPGNISKHCQLTATNFRGSF